MNSCNGGASADGRARGDCFGSDLQQLSHDLRTPLNHVNGFAELLLMDASLSPAQADYVRAILAGSKALQAAVVSYLDRVGTIASGEPTPCAMAA